MFVKSPGFTDYDKIKLLTLIIIVVDLVDQNKTPLMSVACLDTLPELSSRVLGVGSQLLLDPEQLVILGESLRSAGGSGLDLTCAQTNHQVSDEAVLGLTRPNEH